MTTRVARRTALGTLGAAAAAGVAPGVRAQAAPLRVGIIPIFDVAPYYAAQQQGYFAAEGIAVETTVVRGGAAGIPALSTGSLDILYTNPQSTVLAIQSGIDLRLILQGILIGKTPPDPGGMIKRKGDPYKTGKDLEGHVVAANALRDLGWMFIVGWIKATGGDPDKIQIPEIPMAAQAEAVKQKRADAGFLLDPFFTLALGDPALEVLDWPMSRVYAGGPGAFYVITPQVASQRAGDIRAFVRAYKRGASWVNGNLNKDVLFDLIAGYSGMNVDLLRRLRIPPAGAQIVASGLPRVTELMRYTGVSPGTVDLRTKIFS